MDVGDSRLWHSVTHDQLESDRPALAAQLRKQVIVPLLSQYDMQPINRRTTSFVLRMSRDDLSAVYIHVGPFTDNVYHRFSLGLLRSNIGRRGAGVKPRGYGNRMWLTGVMSPMQNAIMQQALAYMEAVLREELQQDDYIW